MKARCVFLSPIPLFTGLDLTYFSVFFKKQSSNEFSAQSSLVKMFKYSNLILNIRWKHVYTQTSVQAMHNILLKFVK